MLFQRCGHPAQQQGLRLPAASSAFVLLSRWFLVSNFLADSIQQIHSLRASGVIFSQAARTVSSAIKTCFRSTGTLCTTPPAILIIIFEILIQKTLTQQKIETSDYYRLAKNSQ
jgi:hypothetical protein